MLIDLDMDFSPLRRLALILAVIVTAVAVPFLIVAGDDRLTIPDSPQAASPLSQTDPLGSLAQVGAPFVPRDEVLAGDEDLSLDPPSTVVIAVPAAGSTSTGRATYRRSISSPEVCVASPVPFGRRVLITNLNNGRSITCRAAVSAVGSLTEVVLHTDAFIQIADLVNAPVPVQIDW